MKQRERISTHTEAINKDKVGDAAEPEKLSHAVKSECCVHHEHPSLKHETLTMDAVGTGRSKNGGVQRTHIQASTSEDNI